MGIFIDHKIIACASVFWPWVCFARFFAAFKNFSGRRCCCICFFLLISFLFLLMKSKQTAVRGPTGGGRPPLPGFIETPAFPVGRILIYTNADYEKNDLKAL